MAKEIPDHERAAGEWSRMKVQCSICNKSFSSWYCPNCGLPKNNSSYYNYEGITYYCGINHFRRDFGTVSDFQLCANCRTPNPYNANFCRNCGENMTLCAVDANGHGWVDLGLSVLWARYPMEIDVYFQWKNTSFFGKNEVFNFCPSDFNIREYEKLKKEDIATHRWGEKWRTPTKEEFEELIKKCTWEKVLYPKQYLYRYVLKATGPNGNSINIPVTEELKCKIWTSSSVLDREYFAYTFWFNDYWYNILCKLIDPIFHPRNTKDELERFQKTFNKIFDFIKQIRKDKDFKFSILSEIPGVKNIKEVRDIVMRAKSIEELRKSMLREWAFELHHFINNEKERLWVETPIVISLDKDSILNNIIRVSSKHSVATIHPVADKKWQGKL